MRVSCVWYASSSLLSGQLKELVNLSCIFCDSNADVAQSHSLFCFWCCHTWRCCTVPQLVLFLVLSYVEMLHSPTACFRFLVLSYGEMLHSPQLVLFLVLSYGEMLHSPQLVLFLVLSYGEMLHSPHLFLFLVVFPHVQTLHSQQFPFFGCLILVW